jgi:muramidase (phage lysozyme)
MQYCLPPATCNLLPAADPLLLTSCTVPALQDTVAVQELRFGDNDTLSAQVRGGELQNAARHAAAYSAAHLPAASLHP